jgi:hypothetical protein
MSLSVMPEASDIFGEGSRDWFSDVSPAFCSATGAEASLTRNVRKNFFLLRILEQQRERRRNVARLLLECNVGESESVPQTCNLDMNI